MGKIITFTGFDGVGKTTHTALILEHLKTKYNLSTISMYDVKNTERYENIQDLQVYYEKFKNYDAIRTRFYLYSEENYRLQQRVMYEDDIFLKTELVKTVVKIAAKDAENWFEHVINPLLKEGKLVIFDRYFYDEIAYRALYGIDSQWISEIFRKIPEPDLSFLLHLSVADVLTRNSVREDSKTQLYNNEKKLEELYINLTDIADKYKMIKIESGESLEKNSVIILEHLNQRLIKDWR